VRLPVQFLEREASIIGNELDSAIKRYVLGGEVESFEDEFSRYVGAGYGVGVNSGSDALTLALMAMGVSAGSEVITVPLTFVSTADSILKCGASPVFVDIEPDTYCMDVSLLESAITTKTAAIIPVHLYGHPVDMGPLMDIAREHDLKVVEDACQAHGAACGSARVGSIGHAGCFSFYPTKNLGALGDAGMVVTSDRQLREKLRMGRNHGQSSRDVHEFTGLNSRLDELQAAILRVKLAHLDGWNEKRRAVAKRYDELLDGRLVGKPVAREYATHVYHQYVVRHEKRDEISSRLGERGIKVLVHYPTPVYRQKAYLGCRARTCPNAEKACREVLSLDDG
jgi:dTDP-4-amino-4,6-dideoxygalactose transaminase